MIDAGPFDPEGRHTKIHQGFKLVFKNSTHHLCSENHKSAYSYLSPLFFLGSHTPKMSSVAQSVLTVQEVDYTALAILTAVGYDYMLTLPDEIEYIWSKPWTCVSALFIMVRYCGLFNLAVSVLVGSSFLPGPATVCGELSVVEQWTCLLFLGAADCTMILRTWAIYNRSMPVLITLVFFFSVEMLSIILASVVYSMPRNMQVDILQIRDYSFCSVQWSPPIWLQATNILQITFAGVVCIFGIAGFMRQSLHMYRAARQWKLGQYMNLLVSQGIVYFIGILLINLSDTLNLAGKAPSTGWQMILWNFVAYVPVFTLTPRFIMSVRKLHAHNVRSRFGSWIDTGFGLTSSRSQMVMVFADDGRSTECTETAVELGRMARK
ncbi:hypothetical protein JVU11DRAFT_8592 [Chiua virens]|nr:hypothetical protein JVU11DRAFT_8592 [Chiua virens]